MRTVQIIVIGYPKDVVEMARYLDTGLEILDASTPRRRHRKSRARLDLKVAAPPREENDD